ncbi:MAG TPA: ABC transporter ATP-binding protein [Rhodospirillaceae bacterium]|nr:ABC transporter ATP-binding protein [Rhodospirillaceae bacterium]MBL25356.1 ABC transporter ATP-binding protein [Rhodospirillaceae bacterium]HAT34349.1 ABC transporter ATP-binding protein [Rhodospirillaceae bacterium]
MTTPKIKLTGVHKRFGDNVVLDGVDLEIMPGESVVIIGGSGTGKSVTIKCILGLLAPDKGDVQVDGRSVLDLSTAERNAVNAKIGMLFQHAALFDSLPVWENVAFGLIEGEGMETDQARDIALEKMAAVGLGEETAEMWPADLSGGMRKRVGLARAIAIDPEIIFFDEPTTGLDPIMGDIINDLIVEITREIGATGLSITHDMASARKIADRIAMLYKGKIIWAGPVEEIDQADNDFLKQFIHGNAEGPIDFETRVS